MIERRALIMASTPKPKKQEPMESDDHLYVSPTSDDTPAQRYQKVRKKEAKMSNKEFLAAIRTPSPLFPDEDEHG
jgi:hypothetical protein